MCGECGLCEGVRRVKEFIQELVQIDQREGVCEWGGGFVCVGSVGNVCVCVGVCVGGIVGCV